MGGFQDLERVHSVLKIVFMMFPNYCLGRGLIELAFNEYKNEFYFKTGETLCADVQQHGKSLTVCCYCFYQCHITAKL